MLTIFVDEMTERLRYTLSIIFDDRAVPWKLVSNKESFEAAENPKLVYSTNSMFSDVPCISPASLLFETEVVPHIISKGNWNSTSVLCFEQTPDILASIFYVVSLYDDFLQTEKDIHGRNIGKNSLLFKMDWLDKCIVEHWSEALISFLEKTNKTSLKAKKIPFRIIPTFDIDVAYAYKFRGMERALLSKLKDVFGRDKNRLQERRQVRKGVQKDPFDNYEKIKEFSEKGLEVKVFWLLGDYGKYDKNISYKKTEQQKLIRFVDTFAALGLHPSYTSHQRLANLKEEKNRLEAIVNREVTISRFHFLKFQLPESYRKLIAAGFTDDYSLAYADVLGFRAGISRPFYWFDLLENKATNLRIHPISYMDGTLQEYMNLSIEEALKAVTEIKQEVQKFGGEFIPLWHNDTIGEHGKWKGWSAVLEKSVF